MTPVDEFLTKTIVGPSREVDLGKRVAGESAVDGMSSLIRSSALMESGAVSVSKRTRYMEMFWFERHALAIGWFGLASLFVSFVFLGYRLWH